MTLLPNIFQESSFFVQKILANLLILLNMQHKL